MLRVITKVSFFGANVPLHTVKVVAQRNAILAPDYNKLAQFVNNR
jgi:hypothetical protein